MPTLEVVKNYADLTILTQQQLNEAFESIEEFVNDTQLDSENIQDGSITEEKLANDSVTADKIADASIMLDKLAAEVSARLTPAGTIIASGATATPTGYLYCNGAAVSRSTFAALFGAISTRYGNGDGATTFNVPDLRGYFLRGQDDGTGNDPDAASRTAPSGGSTGDNTGSYQTDAIESHNHTQNPHAHTISDPTHAHNFDASASAAVGGGRIAETDGAALSNFPAANGINLAATGISINSNTATNNATGGNETRPLNVYVRYYVKT